MADKGEKSSSVSAPLVGLRAVEFTENMVGPYIGQLLAVLGAEVIKVERPGGESMRTRNKGLFASINRGKRSVVLDLKKDSDRSAAQALIRSADIVTESFRPGIADKLGIGYETAAKLKPGLIYLSLSAYGQNGPRRTEPAYDPIIAGYAGIAAQTGKPGAAPEYSVNLAIADMAPVFVGVISILSAVLQKQRGGSGQYLDVSMLDSALLLMMTRFGGYGVDPKGDGRRLRPGSGVFGAGDGKYLAIHAAEPHFWSGLLDVLEIPALESLREANHGERQRQAERINELVEARLREKNRDEWVRLLVKKGIPAGPILDVNEVILDEQLVARDSFETVGGVKYPRFPVRLPGLETVALGPAVALGADTEAVLGPIRSVKV